jgi:plastocyanin
VRFPFPQHPLGAALTMILVLSLWMAGCDPSGGAACEGPTVEIAATVTDSAMDPSAVSACRGQDVTFEVASETDGVFHIHGYDDQVPAVALHPGESQTFEFTADVAGQFIIELHARSGQESTEIGVLTVNEP